MAELIVLSPHYDDAIFSLAKTLHRWSKCHDVTVINCFTRSRYAPLAPASDRSTVNLSRLRRREDRRALAKVHSSIRIIDCGLVDAPVRLGMDISAVCGPQAAGIRSEDVRSVAEQLSRFRTAGFAVAPLGLGNHVDHRTVRHAAIETFTSTRLAFYEDLPYAMWTAPEGLTSVVRGIEGQIGRALQPRVIRSEFSIRQKQVLSQMYSTQITQAEAKAIAQFASRYRGGERIWIPAHSRGLGSGVL